jgi:hypothetical protein
MPSSPPARKPGAFLLPYRDFQHEGNFVGFIWGRETVLKARIFSGAGWGLLEIDKRVLN